MKRIEIEIFDEAAEITSFSDGGGHSAEITFSNLTEGYLTVGKVTHKISCGKTTLDIRLLPEGELTPTVTANGAIVRLPTLFKSGNLLCPTVTSEAYIRNISLRERRLEKRLNELEKRVIELEKSVFLTKIF